MGDRDLGFGPANPPTQRCELAELDYGRELNRGLFPCMQVPISGVSAVLCSCEWLRLPGQPDMQQGRTGQLVALRGGRKRAQFKALKYSVQRHFNTS